MPERYQWQSALASLGLEAQARQAPEEAGVRLGERAPRAQLAIRGDAADDRFKSAIGEAIGLELPLVPNTVTRGGGHALLWLGPDEWLAVLGEDRATTAPKAIDDALDEVHHAVVDVSHSRTVIGLAGERARDVLAKGTNVDLHPRVFGPDRCVQASLARCHMLLHQLDESPAYDIYVHRSFAIYAWKWLVDAGREYGVAVVAA